MKKIKFLAFTLIIGLLFQGCKKLEDVLSINKSIEVNVTVDRSALPAGVTALKVQSFLASVDLEGNSCALKVIDNNEPQLVAVTDQDDHLLMLFRGPLTDGASITVDAASTALAIVTFNPLLGPVSNTDFPQLKTLVEGISVYSTYRNAVTGVIAAGTDLTTATTGQAATLRVPLALVLGALCDRAQTGYNACLANLSYSGNSVVTRPMMFGNTDSKAMLTAAGNCPSYFGHLYNADGEELQEVYVAAPTQYFFMNYLTSTPGDMLGVPTEFTLSQDGEYEVRLSCNDRSALVDLYGRLISNTLTTLGADIDQDEAAVVAAGVRSAVEEQNIQVNNADRTKVMKMIVSSYDKLVAYLKKSRQISGDEGNWDLGSTILRHLFANYQEVSDVTDNMLRTSWSIADDNYSENNGEVNFRISLNGGTMTTTAVE